MRISGIVCALALAVSIGTPPASAEDGTAPDAAATLKRFAGKWEGMWRLSMNSGRIEITLTADPSQPGTVAVTNLVKFGDPPEPLAKLVATDGKIQLRSSGVDNSTMKLSLELKSDDEMFGLMVFDGFTNRCLLKRVQ
jgi:hypothetical protein